MLRRRCVDSQWMLMLAWALSLGFPPALVAQPVASTPGSASVQSGNAPEDAPQEVALDVVLNGDALGLVARFRLSGGRLYATAEELHDMGIRTDDLAAGPDGTVALDGIGGLSYQYVASRQQVRLTADNTRRRPNVVDTMPRRSVTVTPGTGLLLNYDAYAQPGTAATLGLYSEQRFFFSQGVISNTGFATFYRDQNRYIRLDTSYTRPDPSGLTTLQLGDTISGALSWSRSVRLGGVQYRRNFALRPDMVTYPVPQLGATAAVPSAVDLYVNNVRQYSGQVPSGPFVLSGAPALTGSGQATIVVRDVLGRDVATSVPLYVDTRMMAPGLMDYALDVGFLREQYGVNSFQYGSHPAASGSVRYGWNAALTLEGHVEAMPGTYVSGAGLLWGLGGAGVINAAAAGSSGRGNGALFSLGYQLRTPALTLDLQGSRTAGNFTDLAARAGAPFPTALYRATFAMPVARNGNVALNYVHLDDGLLGRSRIGSIAFTTQLARDYSLSLSAYRDFAEPRLQGVLLTLTAVIGPSGSASVSAGSDAGKATLYASASRTPDFDGGWGWQVQGSRNAGLSRGLAQLTYRGRYGELLGGVQSFDGEVRTALNATGSVVVMDGAVLPARRVTDGFALVSTGGHAGVPVLVENRRIGVTDRNGHFLVPNLMPYQANRVGIDALALPANTRLSQPTLNVAPAWQAGALARFDITPIRGGQVVLADDAGRPLPAGTVARLLAADDAGTVLATTMVGYDGLVYFDSWSDRNVIEAEPPAGRCRATVRYQTSASPLPMMGRVTCQPVP